MKAKSKTTTIDNEAGASATLFNPDLRRLLEGLKLPGVNVQSLIESRSKDVEALIAANRRAFEGFQEFSQKQAEILARTMQQLQSGARNITTSQPGTGAVSKVAEQTQQLFTQALNDMRAMADISTRAHQDVISIVNHRVAEGLQAIGSSLGKAG